VLILNLPLDLYFALEAYAINLVVISPVAPCSMVSQRKGDDVAGKGSVASRRHNIS